MSIDSTSTFDEIVTEYKDSANYTTDTTGALARRHVVSIRYLLIEIPSTSTKGSNTVGYNTTMLQKQLLAAEKFANRTNSITRVDFSNIRGQG